MTDMTPAAAMDGQTTPPNIVVCHGDLPDGVTFATGMAAIDTETNGLEVQTVKLCLVQVGDGQGNVWLVKAATPEQMDGDWSCAPNLRALMENPRVVKLFHFARFDVAMLNRCLGIETAPIFCTKIASKLARRDTARHNLRTLVHDYLGISLDKSEQLSDWTVPVLSDTQMAYAASDVLYLHDLYEKLSTQLAEQNLTHAMDQSLRFLPTRVALDLIGFPEWDVFAHH